VCSSAGRATISKVVGRGFKSLRTRFNSNILYKVVIVDSNVTQEVEAPQQKRSFIADLKQELKKVSWTPKEEIVQATKIVIGSTFFLGFSVYLVDLFVKGVLDSIARIAKAIFQ